MRVSRNAILIILGALTVIFLGSSFALWFNYGLIPFAIGNENAPTPLAAATAGSESRNPVAVRITVYETGIAAVTAKQITNAGFPIENFTIENYRLTRNNNDVPFLILGKGESAVLYFYAEASENPIEPLSVYLLKHGKGKPILERDASPNGPGSEIAHQKFNWEEDRFFVEHAGAEDFWMGPLLMAPDKWTYNLDEIQPGDGPAELILHLFSNSEGPSTPDHHILIQVNDRIVVDHTWDGIKHEVITVPMEAGILTNGENIITLLVGDESGVAAETIYIDKFEIKYEGLLNLGKNQVDFVSDAKNIIINNPSPDLIVFDISDRQNPIFLSNVRVESKAAHFSNNKEQSEYIALSPNLSVKVGIDTVPAWSKSLRDIDWGADYIAIVSNVSGFDEAIKPLLTFRQNQDLRVTAVPLEQIYDEFGFGHKSPNAIKAFLAYAAAHWTQPAPRYVLLVGDATYDPKDLVSGKNRNRLPTALIRTDLGGYVADDSWYGQYSEESPPMAIGRFPAQNAIQLRVMVEKTLAYEEIVPNEENSWRSRALLVADDEQMFDKATIALSEKLSENNYLTYRLQMSFGDRIHYNIRSVINEGVGIVNYYGRGSKGTWGDEAVLQNSDAQSLNNGSKLPIFTSFTTLNGAFAEPQLDSLAEIMLRTNNGGVAAAISPSGVADTEELIRLGDLFYNQLFDAESHRIGDVLLELGPNDDGSNSLRNDALTTLNLLGDPALQFYAP